MGLGSSPSSGTFFFGTFWYFWAAIAGISRDWLEIEIPTHSRIRLGTNAPSRDSASGTAGMAWQMTHLPPPTVIRSGGVARKPKLVVNAAADETGALREVISGQGRPDQGLAPPHETSNHRERRLLDQRLGDAA